MTMKLRRTADSTRIPTGRPAVRLLALLALAAGLTIAFVGFGSAEAPAQNSYDQQIIDLTNDHRQSIGRAPLAVSSSLSSGSSTWSQTMLSTGNFRHDPNLGNLGENIAFSDGVPGIKFGINWSNSAGSLPSYCTTPMDYTTPEFVLCNWLSSPPHRNAIDNPSYRQIGVGTKWNNRSDGGRSLYSTMRFSLSAPPVPFAAIASPSAGSELCTGDKISWDGPSGVRYRVQIGTSPGGTQMMSKATSSRSLAVEELPKNGTRYVTLKYKGSSGVWQTAATTTYSRCSNPVLINTASRLCSGQEISWSGPSNGRYRVRIGGSRDGGSIMNAAVRGTDVDAAILPRGQSVHVSLREKTSDGSWALRDMTTFAPCAKPVYLTAPSSNARLCDNDLIDWDGPSSGKYRVRVGTSADAGNVINTSVNATRYNVGDLPSSLSGYLYVTVRIKEADGSWSLRDELRLRAC